MKHKSINALIGFLLFPILILPSCRKNTTCAEAIIEMNQSGINSYEIASVLGLSKKTIKNPNNHKFDEADSLFIISIYKTYKETGELPSNLFSLYKKNNKEQLAKNIESYRQEELKSNEKFITALSQQICEIQENNINKFLDNEINSLSSIKYIWKEHDEYSQELAKALPQYLKEEEIARLFNDSCASYNSFLIKFRDNGIKRVFSGLIKNKNDISLHQIEANIEGFNPQYDYKTSASDVTYQILSSIDKAQDILFTPVNWLLELLPEWLMITILIILLIIGIIAFIRGSVTFTILDGILFVISLIVWIWGDPYEDLRSNMKEQVNSFYSNKITSELNNLNDETNKYYDELFKYTKSYRISRNTSTKSSLQKNCSKDSIIYTETNREDSFQRNDGDFSQNLDQGRREKGDSI